jgi:hypothetical protein
MKVSRRGAASTVAQRALMDAYPLVLPQRGAREYAMDYRRLVPAFDITSRDSG